MRNPHLFSKQDLYDQLESRRLKLPVLIDQISEPQFRVSSDEELVAFAEAKMRVNPLVLHAQAASGEQGETKVDVSGDSRRYGTGRGGPHFIPGTEFVVRIPFEGDEWLFDCTPSTRSSMAPTSRIESGNVVIRIAQPYDAEPVAFKNALEREKKLIEEYVSWSSNDVASYNASLGAIAKRAVVHRRERLAKHQDLAQLLDIPITPKADAPSLTPVKVVVRPTPNLPVPPKTGLKPEPGIPDETFEHILRLIRHQGRTFERAPETFAMHDEEGLRDIMLAQLNGHFRGQANGEAFRRKGKTDISIEEESRSAFVGECKIWKGSKELSEAIDQLLGYLTWRDSKAALIIFNTKVQDFSAVLQKLPLALREHPLFIKELPCSEQGEWRMLMRSEEDPGRRVTVHVFGFNIYSAAKTSSRAKKQPET